MRRTSRSVRFLAALGVTALLAGVGVLAPSGAASAEAGPDAPGLEVSAAVHADVSSPMSGNGPSSPTARQLTERPLRPVPGSAANKTLGTIQGTPGPAAASTSGSGFAGLGAGDYNFQVQYAPPDTTGAVGATQYVQWVNAQWAVFDKATGALVSGYPKPGNSLWAGFGGGCQTNNDGDPIVQYDKLANRWIMTQFSVSTTPYLQCVAVSTTSDATGSYYRYAFSYGTSQFNDYPKVGVWPDGYYTTYNIFNNGRTWAGSKLCAFDRVRMLAGLLATQQCFQLSTAYGGVLPADLDGTTAPPAGSPGYFMNFGSNVLNLWRMKVDWVTPANTALTGPVAIPVDSFATAPSIPQPGTTQKLDSLSDRLMYRLAYRNFGGGKESMVVNHSVTVGTSVGVRWYELQNAAGKTFAGATPVVAQQSTFAPDATYRWMGSIAQDRLGNMALGYSASSTTLAPSIRYTGRLVTDAINTMQAETTLKAGGGSQLATLSRWGDYSSMTVDPIDDCTFWYSTEYLKTSGTFNWSTWISSIRFPSCTSSSTPVLTSIQVSPATASVTAGGTASFTATAYDQSGTALATQPTFSWSVTPGTGCGTVTSAGEYTAPSVVPASTCSVTATSGAVSGAATVTVTAGPASSVAVTPLNPSVAVNGTQQFTAVVKDANGNVLTSPVVAWTSTCGSITSGGLFTAPSAATTNCTVTATSGGVSGSTAVTVTSTAQVPSFTLSATPASQTVTRGGSTTYSVQVAPVNGFSGSVSLAVSLPSKTSATFNPSILSGSGTSTLTIVADSKGPRGTYTLTISGTSGSLTSSTTVTLTIK